MTKINLASDYLQGAHPAILDALVRTNLIATAGYGLDEFSESARNKIRDACQCPAAAVHFMSGGTQTNAVVIDALLKSYQGVIAANTGHISIHEAGAIEFCRHKVLELPNHFGKLDVNETERFLKNFDGDLNHDHMVEPAMIYISQPTEYGTLYSLDELKALNRICRRHNLFLYVDGARLAYALASPSNDVTLSDLAALCDVFYIGGTKCGALIGEAVVMPRPDLSPRFFTIMKQHGALLAKGRLLGLQFDVLFTDGLYLTVGRTAIDSARRLKEILISRGYQLHFDSPTNQIFVTVDNDQYQSLSSTVDFSFWERLENNRTVIRLATNWSTTIETIEQLSTII